MTVYPEPNCSQIAVVSGGQTYWLGTIGHITGLRYSFKYPGGPDKASCLLEVPATFRSRTLDLGSTVRIFRGGHKIWEGRLDVPVPTTAGYEITAAGVGNLGADYLANYTTWPSGQPDEILNNAIGRGLPWVNPTVGQPSGIWLGQQQDNYSRTVEDVLKLACSRGGLGWYVNAQPGGLRGNNITLAPLPVTPVRLLTVTSPVPRTVGGDVKAIYIRYQSSADNVDSGSSAAYAVTSVTNTGHGGQEVYLDLSNAGVLSAGSAQAVGTKILQIYQRASFAGPFDVAPGYLLTMGGTPVDPGCEQAGYVCRLSLTDYAYGGEISPAVPIQFIVGGYEWDDQARKGQITPYQMLSSSLSDVMAGQAELLTPIGAA